MALAMMHLAVSLTHTKAFVKNNETAGHEWYSTC